MALTAMPSIKDQFFKALEQYQRGLLDDARQSFKRVLKSVPDQVDALTCLADIELRLGETEKSLALFKRASAVQPRSVPLLINLATAQFKAGHYEEADLTLVKALALSPDLIEAIEMRGDIAFQSKQHEEAINFYDRAIEIAPKHARAWNNKSAALCKLKQYDDAVAAAENALALEPRYAAAFNNKGNALLKLEREDEALSAFDDAIRINPNLIEAYTNRARINFKKRKTESAYKDYSAAIALNPNFIEAYCARAIILRENAHWDLALEDFNKAIALDDKYARAYLNRAKAYKGLDRWDEALQDLDLAIDLINKIKPQDETDSPEILAEFSKIFAEFGRHEEATRLLELALKDEQDDKRKLALGMGRLLIGNYYEGFYNYEERGKTQGKDLPLSNSLAFEEHLKKRPEIDDIRDRSVLVLREQGVGDVVMFGNLLKDLTELASNVTLAVEDRLLNLFRNSLPHINIMDWTALDGTEAYLDYDVVIKIGSLPYMFRSDFVSRVNKPSYLRADPTKSSNWKSKFDSRGKKYRIGISWRGGVVSTNKATRSLGLASFKSVLANQDCAFVSIQHGDIEDEVRQFGKDTGADIALFPKDDTHNLDDLAALIASLDCVVTVQNSNVHIAGALGIPCITAIPEIPEWRYGHKGSSMPWYQSVELFRRNQRESVESLIDRMNSRLREVLNRS